MEERQLVRSILGHAIAAGKLVIMLENVNLLQLFAFCVADLGTWRGIADRVIEAEAEAEEGFLEEEEEGNSSIKISDATLVKNLATGLINV